MTFPWNRKKQKAVQKKEDEIQSIRKDTLKTMDKATKETKKLNELLKRRDVTYRIFFATGGDRRMK